MVLPLQKLCLNALRNSLKDRPNPYLHEIPPPNHLQNLRQDLIDLVLASGFIIKESAYVSLSSPEFLDGLSQFNTQRGIAYDGEFLDRVADSLSFQRNGKTIGEGITELKLNVYVYENKNNSGIALNLNNAVRIISQCLNLKILHLSFIYEKLRQRKWEEEKSLAGLPAIFGKDSSGGILNMPEFAPCFGVLENVEELSLSTDIFTPTRRPSWVEKCPDFKFQHLSSLYVAGFAVNAQAWKELLMTVESSLIDFEVHKLEGHPYLYDDYDWIMPFPLSRLRSFKVDSWLSRYGCQLIKNLMKCPELKKVEMDLDANEQKEEALRLLSQMNVSLDLKISLTVDQDDDSDFKLVNLFKEKIKKVYIQIYRWNTHHSMALKNMFATCPDLVELIFAPTASHYDYEDEDDIVLEEDRGVAFEQLVAAINSDLAPFLRDQAIVSKLRKLELVGPFDPAVLDALLENATNLESLEISDCPQLSDSHLQLWASCGAKPEHLDLWNCNNISDNGLVPVLISSGQRLKYFRLHSDHMDINMHTRRTLFDHCPFFYSLYYAIW